MSNQFLYAGQYGPFALCNDTGTPQPNLPVTVYLSDGVTAATLYTDRTKALTTSNSIATDAHGNVLFFADPGQYVLAFSVATTARTLAVTVAEDAGDGTWIAFTPSWTAATTNPTIGNGSISGKYTWLGRCVAFEVNINFGSTTTFGSGYYTISLPVNTGKTIANVGSVFVGNGLGSYYAGVASIGNSSLSIYTPNATADVRLVVLGPTVAGSNLSSGGFIRVTGIYEY